MKIFAVSCYNNVFLELSVLLFYCPSLQQFSVSSRSRYLINELFITARTQVPTKWEHLKKYSFNVSQKNVPSLAESGVHLHTQCFGHE